MKGKMAGCFVALACMVLGLLPGAAALDVPQNKETEYQARYQAEISAQGRSITQKEFNACLKRLHDLGFYLPTKERDSVFLTDYIKAAISLFCQCAGVSVQTSFTPLVRALLQDQSFEVRPFFAPFSINEYYERNDKRSSANPRPPYTDKQLSRLKAGAKCALRGKVVSVSPLSAHSASFLLRSEEGAEYTATYEYPQRSTHFVPGDSVILYGAMENAEGTPVVLRADFIGLQ